MKKILETRNNLLLSMNLGGVIESNKPSTQRGFEMIKYVTENFDNLTSSYLGMLYIRECFQSLAHTDLGMFKIVEHIDSVIQNNTFESKLIYCYENLCNVTDKNSITNYGIKTLEELGEKTIEESKNIIRSGALSSVKAQYGVLSLLTEECKVKIAEETEDDVYETITPIVYVEESNDKKMQTIRLGNGVYSIIENRLVQTTSPSHKFSYISSILENLVSYDRKNNAFVYENEKAKYQVTESGITKIQDGKSFVYESNSEFSKNMGMIVESQNGITNKEKEREKEVFDSLVSLQESFGNITEADNFLIIRNKRMNESFATATLGDKHYVMVLNSVRMPNNLMECYDSAIEAVKSVYKKSNYDASHFFRNHIVKEDAETEKKNTELKARNEVVDSIESKIEEIDELINEAKKQGNQSRVDALINNRNVVEALLIEQKTQITSMH